MPVMAYTPVHSYYDLLWPTLQAVIEIGGSGRLDEIVQAVIERERYSESQQAVLHGDGPQTEIEYRLAWGADLRRTARVGCGQSPRLVGTSRSTACQNFTPSTTGRLASAADSASVKILPRTMGPPMKRGTGRMNFLTCC